MFYMLSWNIGDMEKLAFLGEILMRIIQSWKIDVKK